MQLPYRLAAWLPNWQRHGNSLLHWQGHAGLLFRWFR
jgi:hypothetical protein